MAERKPQVDKNVHLQHLLIFNFNRSSSTISAAGNINIVYGKDFMAQKTALKMFSDFRDGNFDLNKSLRTRHSSEVISSFSARQPTNIK